MLVQKPWKFPANAESQTVQHSHAQSVHDWSTQSFWATYWKQDTRNRNLFQVKDIWYGNYKDGVIIINIFLMNTGPEFISMWTALKLPNLSLKNVSLHLFSWIYVQIFRSLFYGVAYSQFRKEGISSTRSLINYKYETWLLIWSISVCITRWTRSIFNNRAGWKFSSRTVANTFMKENKLCPGNVRVTEWPVSFWELVSLFIQEHLNQNITFKCTKLVLAPSCLK